ncbi:MAG TPA: hypothetical protein VFI34_07645 [Candidatus Limnocylindrales bacterium]|nr:hypothetical protein [Candidatus Limnocylindrales bacterium]
MKTVEFSSRRSPAHLVRTTGHKFVAGRLVVPEREAPAIRTYASRFPQFGIREVVPAPPVRQRGRRPAAPAREAVTEVAPAPVAVEPIPEASASSAEGQRDDVEASPEDEP